MLGLQCHERHCSLVLCWLPEVGRLCCVHLGVRALGVQCGWQGMGRAVLWSLRHWEKGVGRWCHPLRPLARGVRAWLLRGGMAWGGLGRQWVPALGYPG